jgi:hypothetical protein
MHRKFYGTAARVELTNQTPFLAIAGTCRALATLEFLFKPYQASPAAH